MSDNTLLPNAQDCAWMAQKFFGGAQQFAHLSDQGWSSMSEDERTAAIVNWRMEQARQRTAADKVTPDNERPTIVVKNLADAVQKLAQQDGAVSGKKLALILRLFNRELSRAINARDQETRDRFHKALLNIRNELEESYHRKYQGQLAQIEALKTERDFLKDVLNEEWTTKRRGAFGRVVNE